MTEIANTLPYDVLLKISDIHHQLHVSAAKTIQLYYAIYKGWKCCDCGRYRVKNKLVEAHMCDDSKGCCFKDVCVDGCLFYCCNQHTLRNQCKITFTDPAPLGDGEDHYDKYDYKSHNEYNSRVVKCTTCGEDIHINRNFCFDLFNNLRIQYRRSSYQEALHHV